MRYKLLNFKSVSLSLLSLTYDAEWIGPHIFYHMYTGIRLPSTGEVLEMPIFYGHYEYFSTAAHTWSMFHTVDTTFWKAQTVPLKASTSPSKAYYF